ncbi:MAG: DNA-processing protein DprA [Alphaproteobacteria bacterium]|jgi:DNA processing protein
MTASTPRPLPAAERLDWLRLTRSENVGPVTFFGLLERFGSAGAALAALPELARRGGRSRPIGICAKAAAEREVEEVERIGARLIALCEAEYPELLAAIYDPPPVIAVRGHPHLLQRPVVAIVGARNASASGRRFARAIAGELGRAELVIASGLARGIDGAAHEGALQTGTVAVCAGGVDVAYPPENSGLYDRIVAEGAALAEERLGTVPQARHFPRRNRMISGLSLGVLVVEAAPRSGSLITARLALEQGREVFAVPGSPLDPRCRGTNDLIRRGAMLTESAADVLEALQGLLRPPVAERRRPAFAAGPAPALDDEDVAAARPEIIEMLGPTPVTVDEIIRQCQLSPAIVSTVLLELELAGRLDRHPGNKVSLGASESI